MVETYQEQDAEEERLTFKLGQEVTVEDLRRIVAPQNTLDVVEESRLKMVGGHVDELLREDLPPSEVGVHQAFLHHLGAEVVLEYLPQR